MTASTDGRHDPARGKKRSFLGGEDESPYTSKRPRFALQTFDAYSRAEQTLLKGAAEVLKIPLETLLAAGTNRSHSGSGMSTGTLGSASTSEPSGNEAMVEVDPQVRTFDLQLPDPDSCRFSRDYRQAHSRGNRAALPSPPLSSIAREVSNSSSLSLRSPVLPWLSGDMDPPSHFDLDTLDLDHQEYLGSSSGCLFTNDTFPSQDGVGNFSNITPNLTPTRQHDPATAELSSRYLLPALSSNTATAHSSVDVYQADEDDSESSSLSSLKYVQGSETVPGPEALNQKGGKFRKPRQLSQKPGQQKESTLTRRVGACIRCSIQRIRVCLPCLSTIAEVKSKFPKCLPDIANPFGCCLTCVQQAVRTRIHWLPCLRYKIQDARLLDQAACPRSSWTVRWKTMDVIDIQTWASERIRTINVTQDVAGLAFDIKVRRFIPEPGDALARKWKTNGVEQSFECAPYGVADMAEAGRTVALFVDTTLDDQLAFYIDESDKLMRDTYMMALRYSRIAEVGHRYISNSLRVVPLTFTRGLRSNSSYSRHCASGAVLACVPGPIGYVEAKPWA